MERHCGRVVKMVGYEVAMDMTLLLTKLVEMKTTKTT